MEGIVLNLQQKEAVRHFKGPMMVLSGPGSGKTTVITYRVKYLIEEMSVEPKNIMVITFTKASALDMIEKYEKISQNYNKITFGTFHSLFFRILRSSVNYNLENVLTEDEKYEIIKKILTANENYEEEELLRNVINEISLVKNELTDIEFYNSSTMGTDEFINVYKTYEKIKKELKKLDFDDMLLYCYKRLKKDTELLEKWRKRYKFFLIDEFQDINRVQYECIKLLASPINNIFIVGDDDQSIYKFRGARPEFLLKFPDDFKGCKKVILLTNYRSTEQIISFSNRIISGNKMRYEKDIVGVMRYGNKPTLMKFKDISSEAVGIAKKIIKLEKEKMEQTENIAVIYRTNMQGRAFADAFEDMKIPFRMRDKAPSIYSHWINKDICAYFKIAEDRKLSKEALRIINKPSRYVSKELLSVAKKSDNGIINGIYEANTLANWQLERIDELTLHLNKLKSLNTVEAIKYIRFKILYDSYIKDYAEYRKINSSGLIEIIEELQEAGKQHEKKEDYIFHSENATQKKEFFEEDKGVTLSTMHSSKGLEYNTVFVVGCIDGVVPYEKSKTEPMIEEERRLFYVALTRAKNNLFLSLVESKYDKEVIPSRFLL